MLSFLHTLPNEILWLLQVLCYFVIILGIAKIFGRRGLVIYIVVAIIAANIQSLKIIGFNFLPYPVGLGTELFASTYLAADIIVEHYGTKEARLAVVYSLLGYFLFTLFMTFAILYPPLSNSEIPESLLWAKDNHTHMKNFFLPVPAFFLAGIIAYGVSQPLEIHLFAWIKKKTNTKFLWLRNIISTTAASFIDTLIFSYLAWKVFAANPIDDHILWSSYIWGTFALRLAIGILDTPFMYLSRYCMPKNKDTTS